jgi:hypothetical protein
MKMSEVVVGMRLRSIYPKPWPEEIVVTQITTAGFIYRIPDDMALVNPHWSMPLLRDGHEHFGIDGEALYQPIT